MSEPSKADKNVFGADTQLHPVTEMPLENGIGAASDEQQALNHCDVIEKTEGKQAADQMRAKVKNTARLWIRSSRPSMRSSAQDHVDTVKGANRRRNQNRRRSSRGAELKNSTTPRLRPRRLPSRLLLLRHQLSGPPPAATKPVLASVPVEPAPAPMVPVPQKGE